MALHEAGSRVKSQFFGFFDFIREQGVVGLAVGFILGGAISRVVSAFSNDLINPAIGLLFSNAELKQASSTIATANFKWGDFAANLIDFFILAAVVYFGFKLLGLDRIDRKKF